MHRFRAGSRAADPFLRAHADRPDPLNVEATFERIRTAGVFAGAQSGQCITALTAVEIALWDIAGKALGGPVCQLLGQIDGRWSDAIEQDLTGWLRANLAKLPVAKEQVEGILKQRSR